MPGFNFRVALDLTSFFEDQKRRCYIYIDVTKLRSIGDLERHVKNQFELTDNIYISTNGYYLPSTESIEILQTNEILKVSRKESRSDEDRENRINEISSGHVNKAKKRADTQSNLENIWAHSSVSCAGFDSAQTTLKNEPEINSDSGVGVGDDSMCLPKSARKKKNKKNHSNSLSELVESVDLETTSEVGCSREMQNDISALTDITTVFEDTSFCLPESSRKKKNNKNKTLSFSESEETVVSTSSDQKCLRKKKKVILELEDSPDIVVSANTRFSYKKSKNNVKPLRKKQKHKVNSEMNPYVYNNLPDVEQSEVKEGSSQGSSISLPCSSNVQFVLQHSQLKSKRDGFTPALDHDFTARTKENGFVNMETEEFGHDLGIVMEAERIEDNEIVDQTKTDENFSNSIDSKNELQTKSNSIENEIESDEKFPDFNDSMKENEFNEECSIIENCDTEYKAPKRKRVRHKKKGKVKPFHPIYPVLRREALRLHSSPIVRDASLKHIRFSSDNEIDDNISVAESQKTTHSLPGTSYDTKPNMRSISKWDEKPPEVNIDRMPSKQSTSALTLDEVLSKTVPNLNHNSTAIVFDCAKIEQLENIKSEIKPEPEIVILEENKAENKLDFMTTSSPLEGQPRKKDIIAFKIFKLSEDYTPGLSNYITARVLTYESNTFTVTLQIVDGHKELQQPQGRFSLEEEEPLTDKDIVELNWNEIFEPRLIFP